ncbi:MAG: ATP-grasp domain-containing protein [Spirochaetes bacterium]|nr:ATP-grasp domain-containing protein [Spirochaetota bacterium]
MFWFRRLKKNNDAFVSLGAGFYQLPLIKEAKKLGFKVICVDADSNAPGMSLADLKIQESICNYHEIENKIDELFLEGRIRGVLSRSFGNAVKTAALLSQKVGIKLFPAEKADEIFDKRKMKHAFKEMEIPSPSTVPFKKNKLPFPYPFVLKPASGHAKSDCRLIADEQALKAYLKTVGDDAELIAENYIEGDEIVAVGLIHKGKFFLAEMTDKEKTPHPYFVDVKHIAPSKYIHRWKEIESYGQKIADYYSIRKSPLVMEFIFTPKEEVFIIEAVPEFGGEFLCDYLIPARSGYNIFRNMIFSCSGKGFVPPEAKKNRTAVCVNYIISKSGIIESFNTPSDKNDSMVAFHMFKTAGSDVKTPKSNHDRVGVVVSKGRTREDAVDAAASIIQEINLTLRQKK